MPEKIILANDNTESVKFLFKLRLPSLIAGLILGILLSFIISQFEHVISKNIAIVFFIPFIVYLASAVGTQTQAIYIRDLKDGQASFKKYLAKESVLGIFFGLIFALIVAPIIFVWFKDIKLTITVSLALFTVIASAPLISLIVVKLFQLEHQDPAVVAGPIAAVIQDTVSVLIYTLIAAAIFL